MTLLSIAARSATGLVCAAGLAVLASGTTVAADKSKTVRVAVSNLPPGKGNPYTGLGAPGIFTWAAMFDSLTRVDDKGVAQPMLATEWKNVDPTTWHFTLRKGVKFSNGEDFGPESVLASFGYIKSGKAGRSPLVRELGNVVSAKAVGDNVIEFKTKRPDPILPNRIASLKLVAPKLWAEKGPRGYAAAPVGTGPYKVKSWGPTKLTLEAFEGSWRAPKAGTLVILELPERAARVQALTSGQVDIAAGLSTDNIKTIEGAGGKVAIKPAAQVMSLALPIVRKDRKTRKLVPLDTPFKDVRVRQALNYAVDRDAIVRGIMGGHAKPAGQGATPGAFGYNPNVSAYPYDPEKAKKLLAEAGYPNGISFTAEVSTGSFPGDSEVYQKMAQDMAKAGIKVTLRRITFPDWLGKYLGRKKWEGQAFGLSWNTAPYLDSIRPIAIFSCFNFFTFTCDKKVAGMIAKAGSEFDPEKRKEILHAIHKANHDAPPAVFLIEQVDIFGLSKKVVDFSQTNRWIDYSQVTVE